MKGEKGIIFISVLILLLILSSLWTSFAIRLHQITEVTARLMSKERAEYLLTALEPQVYYALTNSIYPDQDFEVREKIYSEKDFQITIDIIDAQSKPNINNPIEEEQKQWLTQVAHHCALTQEEITYLISTLSNYLEDHILYQTSELEALLKKEIVSSSKSFCLSKFFNALPEETPLNANTITEETLALILPDKDKSLIEKFIQKRKEHYFTTQDGIRDNYDLGNDLKKYTQFTLVSNYFYSIINFKNQGKSISYESLWHRSLNPQHTFIEKLWTIEV